MSYDITYDIYNADLEWHATLNKIIWHHMWHLSATQKSHVTSYDVILVSYDITCDMYTGLACVTAIVLYIHDICFIQSINKQARLHFTGAHCQPAQRHHTRNVMSCDLEMTSYDITCDIRMPSKGYDVQNGLEMWCHMTSKWHHMMSHATLEKSPATWTKVIWHHMWHWPPPQMSHMTSCDIIWHDLRRVPMLVLTFKIIHGLIMRRGGPGARARLWRAWISSIYIYILISLLVYSLGWRIQLFTKIIKLLTKSYTAVRKQCLLRK